MSNKCYFCEKRKAKYPTIVYPCSGVEKEVETCGICYKRYKKLKDKFLIKAHLTMISYIKGKQEI